MSELRWNPLLAEWVVTATHRQERTYHPHARYCPLCPTRPGALPTEVPAEDYEIVVFENKFPSFSRVPPEPSVEGDDLYQVRPCEGSLARNSPNIPGGGPRPRFAEDGAGVVRL